MNEAAARAWIEERFGTKATGQVAAFADMVVRENVRQNLISPSTCATVWSRHVVDSAQLIRLANKPESWLDVGTGGGFPGMVVALLGDFPVTLVEPRKRRATFLEECSLTLGVADRVAVFAAKVEQISQIADVISARAVASVEKLLQATAHCATPATRWILPRGRLNPAQLADLRRQRGKVFHVEHSLTDTDSIILVVENAA